uniref:Ras homolog family member F, filopodia associated n=1 Tax=Gallus gallus TaxID=9031 RepID=A0A8V1A9X0_CHICK
MEAANGAVPDGAAGGKGGSAAAPSGKKEVKMVIVGDGGCGKTSLLMVYAKGAFPEQYAPSVFEKYATSITIGKKEVILNLYDTAGQEDYDRLRPLSYQNTNVVLICYDVMNPTSYDNVADKWYPEVNHFCQGVPLVLIGCKTDLRKDKEQLRKLRASKQEPITYNQVISTGWFTNQLLSPRLSDRTPYLFQNKALQTHCAVLEELLPLWEVCARLRHCPYSI